MSRPVEVTVRRALVLLACLLASASALGRSAQRQAGQAIATRQITPHVFPFSASGEWVASPKVSKFWTAPTLDCDFDDYSGGATIACTGGTGTKTGTVTSGNATPYYPSNFTNAAQTAAAFAGSDGSFSFGDVLDPSGSFVVLANVRLDTSAAQQIIGKGTQPTTAGSGWVLSVVAGPAIRFTVTKAGPSSTSITSAAQALDGWVVVVASYEYVADGTSILRLQVNSTAATAVTTAVGPVQDVAGALVIGSDSGLTDDLTGWIARVTVTNGISFTAAQENSLAYSYMGACGSTGEEIVFTRATSSTVNTNGVVHTVGNNHPCINENGFQPFGQFANMNLYSEALDDVAWANLGTPTVTANAVAAPDGRTTAETVEDDDGAGWEGRLSTTSWGAQTGGAIGSCYFKAGTTTTARLVLATDGTGALAETFTGLDSTWQRKSFTTTVGGVPSYMQLYVQVGSTTTVTGTLHVSSCMVQNATTLAPYIPTTNAAVTKNADVATRTNGSEWANTQGAMCWTTTAPSIWSAADHYVVSPDDTNNGPFWEVVPTMYVYDGTNSPSIQSDPRGVETRVCVAWDAGAGKMLAWQRGSAATTGTYDGSWGTAMATYAIGSGGSKTNTTYLDAWINHLAFGHGGGWDVNSAGGAQ